MCSMQVRWRNEIRGPSSTLLTAAIPVWTGYKADWLYYLGLSFFLFNLILFIVNCVLISIRFALLPGSFIDSFKDQVESLFIPAVVSFT